jgi:hypothetical protein
MQDGQLPFLNFQSYHSEKLFHHTYYNIEPLDQHIIQEFQQEEGESKTESFNFIRKKQGRGPQSHAWLHKLE